MNELIRELYQQSHSIRHHDGDPMRDGNPPTVYWQGEKSAEKFAELIIRECQFAIVSRTELPKHERKLYNNVLKEHFGVE